MKRFIFIIPIILFCSSLNAQKKPKLVVGIVVDQMRQEYLYRFNDKFSENGFKKLMQEGYMFKNAHYNYVPTNTAPGHTSIYTGSTPALHGIISNHWYDKASKEDVYCAEDSSQQTVGSTSDNGQMSPHRLLTTTISDELRLSNQTRSKVVGISVKDRGAIFPAGHTGEAYWYDKSTGDFITSTYYMEDLPDWVKAYNKQKKADYYLKQTWETVQPIDSYIESGADDVAYEKAAMKDKPVFPYKLEKGAYWMVPETPFGNEMVTEMGLAAIANAALGTDNTTDLLAISYSSTDYIGHSFGPNSKEIEDTYIRLDKNIAQLIETLDEKMGKGNYTMFLTADHAVAEVPQYLIDSKVNVGYFDASKAESLNEAIVKKFGEGDWIEDHSNYQVFLNYETVKANEADLHEVQDFITHQLLRLDGISRAYPAYMINGMDYNAGGIKGNLTRGYNQKRSGDVLMVLEPGWLSKRSTGTTHGSTYTYDTHVPILWFGANVKAGSSVKYHTITDIAPTLSMILEIKLPSGATGQPLEELFEE